MASIKEVSRKIQYETEEYIKRGFDKEKIKKLILEDLIIEYERTPENRLKNVVDRVVDSVFQKEGYSKRKKGLRLSRIKRLMGGRKYQEELPDYQARYQYEGDRRREYEERLESLKKRYREGRIIKSEAKKEAVRLQKKYKDAIPGSFKEFAKKEEKIKEDILKRPPWEKEGFDKKPLHIREGEREEWYKKRRKDLGFSWKKPWKAITDRDIRQARTIAYGEAKPELLEEYNEKVERLEKLKEEYRTGPLDPNKTLTDYIDEIRGLEGEVKGLKKEISKDKRMKRVLRATGRGLSKIDKASKHRYGKYLKDVVALLGMVLIGAIVTGTTGSWLLFFGFLGVALYLVTPDPNDIEPKRDQPITMMSWAPFGAQSRSSHNTAAFFKSFGKITAIACFAFGLKEIGSVFNTLYILTAIFGYFLLKVEYNNSAEFIESTLRFFLGMILIPFIFNDIFDSLVLAGIAFAFFAIPPLPNSENDNLVKTMSQGLSGATAYFEMAQKFLFIAVMLLVLIGSGSLGFISPAAGWGLTGVLKNTFIYFWLVCGVSGFFSPASERPITGAIMLGAATIIYGIGPGSQQVGSGLLGDWWPSVHNTFSTVTEPMSNVVGSLGKTFEQGFMLLTNPVGYATQLMNGSYGDSGTGKVGSFGVDITEVTVTEIFPLQPYLVTAIVENNGASEAKNVKISMKAEGTDRFATQSTARTGIDIVSQKFNLLNLGFSKETCGTKGVSTDDECILCYNGNCNNNRLEETMVWQASFQTASGINCGTITGFDLRKKYIPFKLTTTYEYKSSSRVEVEFISTAEWNRLAQSGKLEGRFKFVESQYTSAPVIFPIGTAGLKNPILETQEFHISMRLDSAFDSYSSIDRIKVVNITFPAEWKLKGCTPDGTPDGYKPAGANTIKWEPGTGGAKMFTCFFRALNEGAKPLDVPSKTYVVTANAEYTFSRWKYKDTLIQFGGFCCADDTSGNSDDCIKGQQICVNNACVTKPSQGETTSNIYVQAAEKVKGYCANRLNYAGYRDRGLGCLLGMGGCSSDSECANMGTDVSADGEEQLWRNWGGAEGILYPLACLPTKYGVNACCYREVKGDCDKAFEAWLSESLLPGMLGGQYQYPDEKKIHRAWNPNYIEEYQIFIGTTQQPF